MSASPTLPPVNVVLLDGCCCVGLFQRSPKSSSPKGSFGNEADQVWPTSPSRSPTGTPRSTSLHRSGSIQNLIFKFSGPDDVFTFGNGHYPSRPGKLTKAYSVEVLDSPPPSSAKLPQSPIPTITVTPTLAEATTVPEAAAAAAAEKNLKAQSKTRSIFNSSKDFMIDSGMGSVSGDQTDRPPMFVTTSPREKEVDHQHERRDSNDPTAQISSLLIVHLQMANKIFFFFFSLWMENSIITICNAFSSHCQ